MKENKLYKAIIHIKNQEDLIIEGEFVAAEFNKQFHLLGLPTLENLKK